MDELSKELLQVRHRLQATEEEQRGKEEEAAMVPFKHVLYLNNTSSSSLSPPHPRLA